MMRCRHLTSGLDLNNVNIDGFTESRFRLVVTDGQTVEVIRSVPVEFHELRRPIIDRRTDDIGHDNGRLTVPGHFEWRNSMINWSEGRSAERSQENAWRHLRRRILYRSTEERSTGRGRLLKQAQVFNGISHRNWSRWWSLVRRVITRGRESSRCYRTTRPPTLLISRPTAPVIIRS